MLREMHGEMSHLEHFFEEFLRTLHEETEGLKGQQCESNRANSLLYRLRDFEITLGLISSRLASLGSSNQFLEDIDELTRALPCVRYRQAICPGTMMKVSQSLVMKLFFSLTALLHGSDRSATV